MNYINKVTTALEKNKPAICAVVGAFGLFASGYIFKKAVDKTVTRLTDASNELEDIHNKPITDKEKVEESLPVYKNVAKDTLKIWVGPAVLLVVSVKTLSKGYKILDERGIATAEAYAVLYSAYQNYRQTVVENYGAAVDVEMANGVTKQVEIVETDEDGNTQTVTEEGWSSNPENSIYSFVYKPSKDIEYDLMELKAAQKQLQLRYDAGKPIFVNEVLELIGRGDMKTQAGQILGWYHKHPNTSGYIDFGIFNDRSTLRKIIDGEYDAIILSLNVDGDVMHCL